MTKQELTQGSWLGSSGRHLLSHKVQRARDNPSISEYSEEKKNQLVVLFLKDLKTKLSLRASTPLSVGMRHTSILLFHRTVVKATPFSFYISDTDL